MISHTRRNRRSPWMSCSFAGYRFCFSLVDIRVSAQSVIEASIFSFFLAHLCASVRHYRQRCLWTVVQCAVKLQKEHDLSTPTSWTGRRPRSRRSMKKMRNVHKVINRDRPHSMFLSERYFCTISSANDELGYFDNPTLKASKPTSNPQNIQIHQS